MVVPPRLSDRGDSRRKASDRPRDPSPTNFVRTMGNPKEPNYFLLTDSTELSS